MLHIIIEKIISNSAYKTFKDFYSTLVSHNLFLHASSISYYVALALAPFILILLSFSSVIGFQLQDKIIHQAEFAFGPQVKQVFIMVFSNVNQTMHLSSFSRVVGSVVILFTSSMVFVQLRDSLDLVFGYHDPEKPNGILKNIQWRFYSMIVVLGLTILFLGSLFVTKSLKIYFGHSLNTTLLGNASLFVFNFLIYIILFAGIYYIVPSKKTKLIDCLKISFLSSTFFMFGKKIISIYLKKIAPTSIYGAAGSLLVFLIWTYYSFFIIFFSVELFAFYKRHRDNRLRNL